MTDNVSRGLDNQSTNHDNQSREQSVWPNKVDAVMTRRVTIQHFLALFKEVISVYNASSAWANECKHAQQLLETTQTIQRQVDSLYRHSSSYH